MSNVLIIGMGEIGSAVKELELDSENNVSIYELETSINVRDDDTYDVCHICIPYSSKFEDSVVEYLKRITVGVCIIHSTVRIGTCDRIQPRVKVPIAYSFVRGVHPNLAKGLRTFVKYVYGKSDDVVTDASDHLQSIGMDVVYFSDGWSNGEVAKLLDTTYYGYNILFAKHVNDICERYGLDYDKVYTLPNQTYNEGYTELGKANVIRPVLTPPDGEIGGHCVVPNFHLLPASDLKDWCLK